MIKNLLLKLAHKINKHYNTIEIKNKDYIKFGNGYFQIKRTSWHQDIEYGDKLEIEAYDVGTYLNSI